MAQAEGMRARLGRVLAPLAVTLALFAAYVAVYAVPGAWLLTILLVAPSPVAAAIGGAFLALGLTWLFWRRHWISGAAMLAGLVALVLAVSLPDPADSLGGRAIDLAHVVAYRGTLQEMADQARAQGVSPVIAVHAIDGFGSMTSGIAYDESGEVGLPPEKRSKGWQTVAGETELSVDGLEARHIIGGYYAWFHY